MKKINLNSDIGEGFGAYNIGNDEAMLELVKSANIACGFHAGDPNVMDRVIRASIANGVSIGAHPGFNDIWGFGRRQIHMPMQEIEASVAYQLGALQAIAVANGGCVTHVKPHGALNNMSSQNIEIATAISKAVHAVDQQLILVAVANSHLFNVGKNLGLKVASEVYADRTYDEDGNLTSRKYEHAMIKDPVKAAEQVRRMVIDEIIVAHSGKEIPVNADTICIHGDEPTGPAVASAVKNILQGNNIDIRPLPELDL